MTTQPVLAHQQTAHEHPAPGWPKPPRVLAAGTFLRDYPSNALVLQAARALGCPVDSVILSLVAGLGDRLAPFRSPVGMVALAIRFALAEARLLWRVAQRWPTADVLFVGYPGQLDAILLGRFARRLGRPLLYAPLVTLTETLIEDRQLIPPASLPARLLRWLDRAALQAATIVIADTAEQAQAMRALAGLPASRLVVLPVGADETVFAPEQVDAAQRETYRRAWPASSGEPLRVLFYGSFIPLHGVETIVHAFAQLSPHDVSGVLIGDGQCWERAYQLAADRSLRHLRFLPPVPYRDLPAWIAAADVVLGIFGDTAKAARVVPNKVYQAMAMGAAIVTRDSPAARALLHHDISALLVPPADPAALAAALLRLRDPAVRARLGQGAREAFQRQASAPIRQQVLGRALQIALAQHQKGGRP